MARSTGSLQGFAAQAIESFFARAVGEAIYRADRKDAQATLTDLTFQQQAEYERIGTFVLRLNDRSQLRAGLYAGADTLVQGGIGSLPLKSRAAAVGLYTRAFMAMKAQMNGSAPPDTADLMRALVEADEQAGLNQVPVTPADPVDLASVAPVTTEVM